MRPWRRRILRVVTQLRPRFTKATQLFRNRALAYSKVGTRSERVIGHVDGERPELAQTLGTAARLVDSADPPARRCRR